MIGEIIAIGDELTSGRILNLTSNFAAHHLFAIGHEIVAMATIGDSSELIGSALKKALARADFVIVTGGLGPTSDDLTNEAVSTALNRPATFHPEILDKIKHYLAVNGNNRGCHDNVRLEKLAWLPAGAEVLKPEANMAGYLLIHEQKPVFFLPGVPHEMKELLTDSVIPRLNQWQGQEPRFVRQRLYLIFGLSETEVNHRLKSIEEDNSLVRIGYYPVFPDVHLNLTALGTSEEEKEALFHIFDKRVKKRLGASIYGYGDDTMAIKVGELLRNGEYTLALAESCTGGLVSHNITTVPGSSDYFIGGVTAYSNQLKMALLNVNRKTLEKHGAVSPHTARAMASGVCKVTGADIGLSITGIAGPSGGSEEKPVGTVYFALDFKGECRDYLFHFSGQRDQIQILASQTALDLIRRKLLEEKKALGEIG